MKRIILLMFVCMAFIGVQQGFAQTTVGGSTGAPFALKADQDAVATLELALSSQKSVMSQFIPGSAEWDQKMRVFDLYGRTREAILGGLTVDAAVVKSHGISYGMSAVPVTLVTKTESESALANAYALLKL